MCPERKLLGWILPIHSIVYTFPYLHFYHPFSNQNSPQPLTGCDCSISDNDYINPQIKKKTRSSIDLDIYNFRRVPAAFHIFGYTSVVTTTDFKFYSEIYNRTKKQRRQKFYSFMVTIELKKKNSLTHNSENILIVFLSLSYKKVIQVL